jgi:hypothetical protein
MNKLIPIRGAANKQLIRLFHEENLCASAIAFTKVKNDQNVEICHNRYRRPMGIIKDKVTALIGGLS